MIGKLPDATGVRQQQSQEEKQGVRSLCSAGSLGKSLFGELASPAASRDLAWLRNLLSPAEEWEVQLLAGAGRAAKLVEIINERVL